MSKVAHPGVSSFPILLETLQCHNGQSEPDHDLQLATYEQGSIPAMDIIHRDRVLENDERDDCRAAWTPSGALAFISQVRPHDNEGQLYLKSHADGNAEPVASDRVRSVAYSPNGNEMAFVAWARDKRQFMLWRARSDGSHCRPVHVGGLEPSDLTYSPDGRSLVFSCTGAVDNKENPYDESHGLRLLNLKSGHIRRLTSNSDWAPSFSPDGKTIVFERDGGWHDSIQVLNVESGHTRTLQETPERRILNPTYTPDGSRILFAMHSLSSHDLPGLWVISSKGGPATWLMECLDRAIPTVGYDPAGTGEKSQFNEQGG